MAVKGSHTLAESQQVLSKLIDHNLEPSWKKQGQVLFLTDSDHVTHFSRIAECLATTLLVPFLLFKAPERALC